MVAPLLAADLDADDLTTIATCVIAALAKASGKSARATLLALFDALPDS